MKGKKFPEQPVVRTSHRHSGPVNVGPRVYWSVRQKFTPHEFGPQISLSGSMPEVLIVPEALAKMYAYICAAGSDEISWLGTVEDRGNKYIIKEIFLVEQTVNGVETEMTAEGMAELSEEFMVRPDGETVWKETRFWGHFHPFSDAGPSAHDERQLHEFLNSGHEFFLRGICSANGIIQFTLYLINRGIIITDVPWSLNIEDNDELRQRTLAEVKEKVRKRIVETVRVMGGGHSAIGNPPYGRTCTRREVDNAIESFNQEGRNHGPSDDDQLEE